MAEPRYLNAYIDESGDEKSSDETDPWFVLGAVVVPAEHDDEISRITNDAKTRMGKQRTTVVKWSGLQHPRRVMIAQSIAAEARIRLSHVLVDKRAPEIRNSKNLKAKNRLYFYATRYLLERLSWMARDFPGGRIVRLAFEYRSSIVYQDMWAYLNRLRMDERTQIAWDHVDIGERWEDRKVRVLPKKSNRLVQMADWAVGAAFNALVPDEFGNCHTNYLEVLAPRLYRYNGRAWRYGLKFMPNTSEPRTEWAGFISG